MQAISTSTLLSSGRKLVLPARVDVRMEKSVGNGMQTLELIELLRVLPRKRVVALARWQGALVVAKLFFARRSWDRHQQREMQGITALNNAGIKTADLIGSGTLQDGQCGFLLLRYIDKGERLGECWSRVDILGRETLLQKVITLIADCHERGLLQKDIHLDNFLLKEGSVFLIDTGDLEHHQHNADGVDSVNSLRNLALFFAQFPIENDALVPALYEYYRQQRPSADLSEDIAVFAALLRKKRALRLKIVFKKLYIETSENTIVRDWNHFIVYKRTMESTALQAFVQAPDTFIENGKMIKAGSSTTVALIEIDNKQYVVKRYNMTSLWYRVRRLFRPSRAWVCWRNAHMLEMLGISTPKPLLMMEWRYGPLRREAYLLCEYIVGEDALQLLKKEPINSPTWMRALREFKTLFAAMRDFNIVHGDMKATNFLVTEQGLVVLDLDGMHQELDIGHFSNGREKDLKRFAKNWKDDPARAQMVQTMFTQLHEESDYFTKGS